MFCRRSSLLLLTLVVGLVWVGSAAASCNPNRSNKTADVRAGWSRSPGPGGSCITGTFASFNAYFPYITGISTSSGAFVELYDASTSGQFAAEGYEDNTDVGKVFWMEDYGRGFFRTFLGPAPGTSHSYEIVRSGGAFHFYIDNSDYYDESDTIYQGCSTEQGAFLNNELNQMVGGYNAKLSFTASQFLNSLGWHYTNGTTFIQGNINFYGVEGDSTSLFKTWDWACAT